MGEVREGFWRRHRILLVSRIPGRAARDPGPKAMRICSWTPDRLRRPGMWSPSLSQGKLPSSCGESFRLKQRDAQPHRLLRRQEDRVAVLAGNAEHEHLGYFRPHLPRREIHHRKDLLPDERVARIVAVSAAGNFRPDLTPEIHCHSIGRLPCLRVFDFDGAPDADVQCFEMREVGDEF